MSIFGFNSKTENSNSKIVENYLTAASLLKESGDYEKAIDILLKASAKNKDPRLDQYLGRVYFLSGKSKDALGVFKKKRKKDWLDFLYLGLIHEESGEYTLAIRNFKKSLNLRKTSISLYRLAKIYRRLKKYDQAVKNFKEVIRIDSSIVLASYYLGDCLFKLNENSQAYKYLVKAINVYPDSGEIKDKLKEVKDSLGEEFFNKRKIAEDKKRKAIKLAPYLIKKNIPLVKVGIALDLSEFSFSCGSDFIARDSSSEFKAKANQLYTIVFKNNKILMTEYQKNEVIRTFSSDFAIRATTTNQEASPFLILNVLYGKGNFWHKQIDRVYKGSLSVTIKNSKMTLINILNIEDYLKGVLSAEIPARSPKPALRAQAVAARTLAVKNRGRHKSRGFDFCADVHCQVYHGVSAETSYTTEAVDDTYGEVITYKEKPVEAFYHSNSGGCLSADTFGEIDYLEEKIDSKENFKEFSAYSQEYWFFDDPKTFSQNNGRSSYRWQRVYDSQDFLLAFGYKISDLKNIIPLAIGDCYHYKELKVITSDNQKQISRDLKIRNYFDKLRSSSFKVEIKTSKRGDASMIFFWGAGFGHGAGMSQEGAINMGKQGYDYKEILSHYYPKTTLSKSY